MSRLICRFAVEGRPVPWSVPPQIRRKNPKLVAWQRLVNFTARLAWARGHPYSGPVELRMEFRVKRRAGRMADVTNLQKAAEDSLQNAVIIDDTQVATIRSTRVYAEPEGVVVEVYAIEIQPAEVA